MKALLEQYHPVEISEVTTFKVDHLIYILDLLVSIPVRNRKTAESMNDGYTPLCAHALQRVVPFYHLYLDYLIRSEVIEVYNNGAFRLGVNGQKGESRKYRLAEKYRLQPIRCVAASDARFTKKKRCALSKEEKRHLQREYGHLLEYLQPNGRLRIDAVAARSWNWERLQLLTRYPILRKVKKGNRWDNQNVPASVDPIEQYNHTEYSIGRIEHQQLEALVDDKVHRLHTPLTNMSSGLRNFLTYDGEQLVSLDIANSQPYIATLLLRRDFYENSRKVLPRVFFNREGIEINKEREGYQMEYPSIILQREGLFTDKEDVDHFCSLVSSGSLYLYLQDEFRKRLGAGYQDKRHAKEAIFEVLFAKNRYSSERKKLFESLFPTVARVFRLFKEEDSTMLPRLLQMLEAHIVLKKLCKTIAKKHPNIPLLTIHDSIVIPVRFADQVERIMKNELELLVGLAPTIKREYWDVQEATNSLAEMVERVSSIASEALIRVNLDKVYSELELSV